MSKQPIGVIVLESLKTRSARFLTVDDGMGFSYHLNRCDADSAAHLWYKHHWESNHILSGTGRVEDLSTGESWELAPGMLYNVGPKDRHRVTAKTDIHLLSVFSPPLRGDEQHDAGWRTGAERPGATRSTGLLSGCGEGVDQNCMS